MKYCKLNQMYVIDSRSKKKEEIMFGEQLPHMKTAPSKKVMVERWEYKMENGKWKTEDECKIVDIGENRMKELSIEKERKRTGKHFVRHLEKKKVEELDQEFGKKLNVTDVFFDELNGEFGKPFEYK